METLQAGKVVNTRYKRVSDKPEQAVIELDLRTDWDAWQKELKRLRKVRIELSAPGQKLTCSLYRKKHPNSPLGFWYAQKRIERKLKERYIGADSNLTVERLSEVVREFYQTQITPVHS